MEHANIVIFEDNKTIRQTTVRLVSLLGHAVTAEAATLETALQTIDEIDAGSVACDAVILDGNLRPNVVDGSDAVVVAERLQKLDPPVKIIGFSTKSFEEYGVEVFFDTHKEPDKLREALGAL
jgi:CheY-like chemotaxis protein